MAEFSEKELYAEARKKDAVLYLIALLIAVVGFSLTPPFSPFFSLSALITLIWSLGIMRKGRLETEFLLEAEPIVEKMKAEGMTEHDAMLKCEIDMFYYSPFWAVR